MKRILLMFLRSFFFLPYYLFQVYRLANVDKYDKLTRYRFIHKMVPVVNRRGKIKVECFGVENLPKESGYILFPNHQGMFDALAIFETHERPLVTVMKKEVKDVFLLKKIIQMLQAEIIDREDIRQSMTVINNMARRVKEGENFILFAEGTRSRKQNQIGEFKGGSFKSAYYAKCPIVPVALIDSYKPFDTGSTKPVTVQIHYLEPIYYDDYKHLKTTEISHLVSERIRETIAAYADPSTL